MSDLLNLPRFLRTARAVLIRPRAFFSRQHPQVQARPPHPEDLTAELPHDPHLGPLKFAVVAVALDALLLPLTMEAGSALSTLGAAQYGFYRLAQSQGWLGAPTWTGIDLLAGLQHPDMVFAPQLQGLDRAEVRDWYNGYNWTGEAVESGCRRGHTFSHPHVLIAASAAHHGLTVVTRDTADFEVAGVTVCNPWRQSAAQQAGRFVDEGTRWLARTADHRRCA